MVLMLIIARGAKWVQDVARGAARRPLDTVPYVFLVVVVRWASCRCGRRLPAAR